MLTVILSVALLIALTGLAVEIGIASWSIRRAKEYKRRAKMAEDHIRCIESARDGSSETSLEDLEDEEEEDEAEDEGESQAA